MPRDGFDRAIVQHLADARESLEKADEEMGDWRDYPRSMHKAGELAVEVDHLIGMVADESDEEVFSDDVE